MASGRNGRKLGSVLKRTLDLAGAAAGLVVLSPALAVLAMLVRARLGRPVLFVQQRPGLDGQPFALYKFRTMLDAIGPDGRPLPDAQRLTELGAALLE